MELPRAVRQAVDAALEGVPLGDLRRAAEKLSSRYRAELRDGRPHLSDGLAVRAYLATRMPATYAAIRAVLDAVAEQHPVFDPVTMLDVGAGPGTATIAACVRWPALTQATLIENAAVIRDVGESFVATLPIRNVDWLAHDVSALPHMQKSHDLVLLAYVLDELSPNVIPRLMAALWDATADVLVVIEPGTPGGWARILKIRAQLIAAGAHLVAPCPHALSCPLTPPDWCHFSRRVARSRMHRQAKSAEVPWEDEKYIYIAASRRPVAVPQARVIAPPTIRGGTVTLKLCQSDGSAVSRLYSRRDGGAFKQARRAEWGDPVSSLP